MIPRFKSKDELLEEEFTKFVADHTPEQAKSLAAIKTYFKAYATDGYLRDIIDKRQFSRLATSPVFSIRDYRAVPEKYRALIPRVCQGLRVFEPIRLNWDLWDLWDEGGRAVTDWIRETMRQVVIYPGEDGYWVAECPSLPGCISQGATKQEAIAYIKEAIEGYISALQEDGLPVP